MIRRYLLPLMLLALAISLQSCGLKGDLYLPPDEQGDAADHARETSASEQELSAEESDEDDDPFGDDPDDTSAEMLDMDDAASVDPLAEP